MKLFLEIFLFGVTALAIGWDYLLWLYFGMQNTPPAFPWQLYLSLVITVLLIGASLVKAYVWFKGF